jgi:hypothetical protein
MDRNQAKEFYPILQAFAEGKEIECRTKPGTISAGIPNEWTEIKEIGFWSGIEYRIKPDQKYRQFKDAEECWQEMLKHQPFGWIKGKDYEYHTFITTVDNNDEMSLSGNSGWSFIGIMNNYTFADGTPFGMKEEE